MAESSHEINRNSILSAFCTVTGVNTEQALFYLESANWNLMLATQSYFENANEGFGQNTSDANISDATNHIGFGTVIPQSDTMDISDDDSPASPSSSNNDGRVKRFKQSVPSSNIMTFNSLKRASNDSDESGDDDDGQEFYAGGGQQVIGPKKDTSNSQTDPKFPGTGHRLASDEPMEHVHDLTPSKSGKNCRKSNRMAKGREVNRNREDHRHEDYADPNTVNGAFIGEGHRLRDLSADVITTINSIIPDEPKKCEDAAYKILIIDESKPVTNVIIRFADGSRLTLKLNLTHTIGDIRQYIRNARPAYSATPFVLMQTFPSKELSDDTLTVEKANLQNACIVLHIK